VEAAESSRRSVVDGLRPTLFVTLRTDVRQHHGSLPAVQEFLASVQVEWSPDDGPDVDLAALSALAHVDAATYLPELSRLLPETLIMPVGNGRLVSADLLSEMCWDELSALGLDVALVGEALLGEHFDLAELTAEIDLVHGRAVIVNSMEISPDWRGAQYGLLAAELALRELGRCADVAALYPMRPGLEDLDERAAANRALSQYWARLGFVDFNGIMILRLNR
jgi:GNAT superfamily N-acetyltransferase